MKKQIIIVTIMFIIALIGGVYTYHQYETCNGHLVRGIIGYHCIQS